MYWPLAAIALVALALIIYFEVLVRPSISRHGFSLFISWKFGDVRYHYLFALERDTE